jgi:hypothetical protein
MPRSRLESSAMHVRTQPAVHPAFDHYIGRSERHTLPPPRPTGFPRGSAPTTETEDG